MFQQTGFLLHIPMDDRLAGAVGRKLLQEGRGSSGFSGENREAVIQYQTKGKFGERTWSIIRNTMNEVKTMTDIKQLPEAFLSEMRELLGDEYNSYALSFGENWKPGLRVNTLKIRPEQLASMVPWAMEPVPWTGNGFYYRGKPGEAGGKDGPRPSRHPAYYCGLYYIQEPSAMAPAALLPVEPGDRVLDLCAAPGGKSTELGARLRGKGLLASNDVSCSRARALLKNLELAGIPNLCVTSESPEKLAGVWPEFFDKILVDGPCSGEGMFRREEGMIKDWTQRGPAHYAPLQRQIVSEAVKMLRPGGMLLYSTCTFSREEDETNIRYILDRHPQMELCPLDLSLVPGSVNGKGMEGCMRLYPHRLRGEGHFLALLQKKPGRVGEGRETASHEPASLEHMPPALAAPEKETSALQSGEAFEAVKKQKDFMEFLQSVRLDLDRKRLVLHQDHIYYLPQGLEWGLPLRFLRTGLLLGEMKKDRFEPSQAFAMVLGRKDFKTTVRLGQDDERVIRYLKGETVALGQQEGPVKGWCLVCMEDYPMGWAKGTGMALKNKYYPGWRWQ